MKPGEQMFDALTWLGHAGVLIEAGLNIYIDPFNIPEGLPKADLVLVTHPHYDHCSSEDIAKVSTEKTALVGPADCLTKLKGRGEALAPGQSLLLNGVKIQAVAAYNHKKPYHPKAKGWLGFLIEIQGTKIYHAGDTDAAGEMAGAAPDIAILPLDRLYNLDVPAAMEAVRTIRPKRALPVHFGTVSGSRQDAARFLAECEKLGLPGEFYRRERCGVQRAVIPPLASARVETGSAA